MSLVTYCVTVDLLCCKCFNDFFKYEYNLLQRGKRRRKESVTVMAAVVIKMEPMRLV
jgi:hypothetical protein